MATPVDTEEGCITIQDNGREGMVTYSRHAGSSSGHIQ
jgi:hypothetical protein